MLNKKETECGHATVRQRERGDLEVPEHKGPVDDARFGYKVTSGPRTVVECVSEDPPQIVHCGFVSINGQGIAAAQIAETPAIVQAHDMVGMGMGEQGGVEPLNILPQHLKAKLWSGVDYQFCLVRRDVDRGAHPVIFRIGQEFPRILFPNNRDTLRSAGTKKDKRKRHLRT